MNVILLSSMWPRPGLPEAGIFVLEQAKELHKAGCYVQVVAPVPWSPKVLWFREKWRLYGQAPRTECLANLWVTRPRYLRPAGRVPSELEALAMEFGVVRHLTQLAKSFSNSAVLHAHRLLPEGLVAVQLKRRTGLPVVVTGHGGDVYGTRDHSKTRRLAQRVLQAADAVVGVSQYIAEILMELGARSVDVIPNGYHPEAIPSSTSAPRFGQRVLYVGRLDSSKGVFDLLTAFGKVQPHVPSATLTYVGDGPARPRLEQMISQRGVTNVSFRGRLPHESIPAILAEHQVFVLPSYAEGLPTALIEAMAGGLAVLATPVGGVPELVVHGETGLLFTPGDVAGLSSQLRLLLSDEPLQLQMQKAARDAVSGRYDWAVTAQQLIKVYARLTGRKSALGRC